jgi:hypothetical protein
MAQTVLYLYVTGQLSDSDIAWASARIKSLRKKGGKEASMRSKDKLCGWRGVFHPMSPVSKKEA